MVHVWIVDKFFWIDKYLRRINRYMDYCVYIYMYIVFLLTLGSMNGCLEPSCGCALHTKSHNELVPDVAVLDSCDSLRVQQQYHYVIRIPLGGSWDLVTRVISKVTIVIIAYNPD